MLPGLDGFQICKRLREDAGISTPILMLTARDQLQDKLKGFEGGADDYLIKPFDLPELAARINALIRRERGELREKALQVEDLMMDTRTLTVTRQSKPIHLTPIGFRILKLLMRESPNVVTREDLERDIWGDDPPTAIPCAVTFTSYARRWTSPSTGH
jgi:DNA-binding response OmpR family regulator